MKSNNIIFFFHVNLARFIVFQLGGGDFLVVLELVSQSAPGVIGLILSTMQLIPYGTFN